MFSYPYLTLMLILSLFAGNSLADAREVKLTTYYPSPNGNYDTLSVNKVLFKGAAVGNRDCTTQEDGIAIENGQLMMDNIDGTVFICTDPDAHGTQRPPFWRGSVINGTGVLSPSLNTVKVGYQYGDNRFAGLLFSGSTSSLQLVNGGNAFLDVSPTAITVPNNRNLTLNGGNIVFSSGVTKEYYYDLDLTGNVGMANAQVGLRTQKKLAVYADTKGDDFFGVGYSDRLLQFHSASSSNQAPQMVLKAGGLLGINNVAPTEALDVTGNQKISGTITAGATGNQTVVNGSTITTNNVTFSGDIANSTATKAGIKGGAIKLSTSRPATLENGMMWLE